MAGNAVLTVQILTDTAKAAAGLNDTAAKFESFGKKLASVAITAVAVGGVTQLAKSVVTAASDMQQAMGGTDKVFGSSAAEIHQWAADTEDSIRLPAVAVERFATLIKTQLSATGQPMAVMVKQTKDLVQVGADLAAVTGVDLADSISAVKGALAGEYDPIQNLGVAMSGTTVQAKALAIAHGDTELAASSAVVAQARVAEIMEKSAFATGAAAEEADSFQGRMDSLKEQVSGLAAAVGGPMLDALSGIVGGLADSAAGAQQLGVGLGTMLGAVLSLPGPIQAIVVGLLALVAVSAKWGAATTAAFTGFIGNVRNATTTVGGFKAALGGIASAVGGGALLLGIGAVIAAVAIAIGRVTEAAGKGKTALSGYVDALVESGNKSTDATAAAFKSALLTSDAYKELVKDGFSAAESVRILTGTQEDWHAVMGGSLGTIHNLNRDTMALVDGFIDANGEAGKLAQAQIDGAAAMGGNSDATAVNTDALADNTSAADKAKDMQDELARKLKEVKTAAENTAVALSLGKAEEELGRVNRAVEYIRLEFDKLSGRPMGIDNATAAWSTGIQQMKDDFKEFNDKVSGGSQALRDFDVAQINSTSEGQKLWGDLRTAADDYSALLANVWQASQNGGDTVAQSIEKVKAAAGPARQSLVDMIAPIVGGPEEADKLLTKFGIINSTDINDKTFEYIADDTKAMQTQKLWEAVTLDPVTQTYVGAYPAASEVAAQLNATFGLVPPQVFTMKPSVTPGAFGAVIDAEKARLGIGTGGAGVQVPVTVTGAAAAQQSVASVKPTPNQAAVPVTATGVPAAQAAVSSVKAAAPVVVTVTANLNQATAQVNAFTGASRQVRPLDVNANVAQATATVNNFAAAARSVRPVDVNANVTSAYSTILTLTSTRFQASVTVSANTGPALSAIHAVENGSYTATVKVVADTSRFTASFNSLPTSKPVGLGTQAAPSLARGLAAPTLNRAGVNATGSSAGTPVNLGTSTVNVTVQAGIGDPDAIARTVRNVLDRRTRRSAGIAI